MTGIPAIQPGATPIACRQAPTRSPSEGSADAGWRALLPMPRLPRSAMLPREPLAGTTVHTFPGTLGHLPAWFPQFSCMKLTPGAGTRSLPYSPYKRGAGGSNPPAPTKFLQLDGLFETLIGNPVTTAGNHRCMLPDGGRVPKGHGSIPFGHQGAPCADGRHHRH